MSITYDFKARVALVTGAASGIGLATARAFAHAGASVTMADVSEAALQQAVEQITSAGGNAIGVVCDVSAEAQVAAMVERTVTTFGRLDAAFNNAGIQVPSSEIADQPAEDYDRISAVNLRGVWACMKHELLQMRKQGSGAIVNCSSIGGLVGRALIAAYHGTKHGVIGLTRSAALEYAARGTHPNVPSISLVTRMSDAPSGKAAWIWSAVSKTVGQLPSPYRCASISHIAGAAFATTSTKGMKFLTLL